MLLTPSCHNVHMCSVTIRVSSRHSQLSAFLLLLLNDNKSSTPLPLPIPAPNRLPLLRKYLIWEVLDNKCSLREGMADDCEWAGFQGSDSTVTRVLTLDSVLQNIQELARLEYDRDIGG